jgi:hypothetical protein
MERAHKYETNKCKQAQDYKQGTLKPESISMCFSSEKKKQQLRRLTSK